MGRKSTVPPKNPSRLILDEAKKRTFARVMSPKISAALSHNLCCVPGLKLRYRAIK